MKPEEEHFSARYGKPILFIVVALSLVGAYLATTIPLSVFPVTNFPRIFIGVDNGVMPIDQMLVTVTRPLEEAANTIPGLQTIRSITARGSAEINLFFDWNVDKPQTLNLVNAALARAQSTLPASAKVTASRLSFAAFPILGYSLTSSTSSPARLWEIATYDMKPRLTHLPGVSNISIQGGEIPEFQIEPDPARLVAAQVTVSTILDAISKSNLVDSPGLLDDRHQLVLALVSGQTTTPQQIGGIVLKVTSAGVPVRIADVATVSPSVQPVYTAVTANGSPAVLMNIFRQPDSNTAGVASAVRAELERIRDSLPKGIRITPFYDQSVVVESSVSSVRDAIFIGLVMAMAVMILFLHDWRSSLVAGMVIPATIAITCIALRVMNQTFNLMTLGGLAAAVGLVIDDAIVVVENIVRHRQSGASRGEAVRSALAEIRIPLLGATVAPIVVFLPMINVAGVNGTFFRALAVTVSIALLTSLALALTWTPALSFLLLRETKPRKKKDSKLSYARWINLALDRPWVLIGFALVLIGASGFCYRSIGSDLLPEMDEGGFIIDYLMPAGTSLDDTNQVLSGVEKILGKMPEVESTARRTGLQLGLASVTEAHAGDMSVKLKTGRRRNVEEVIADARKQLTSAYPMLDIEFVQVLQDMIGDLSNSPDPVEVKLFSPDASLLSAWSPKIADAISKIKGVVDVKNGIENAISGPAVVFNVDSAAAARSGFTPQEVERDASAILQGELSTTPIVVNDRAYALRVRFPPQNRTSLDQIRQTLLVGSTGRISTLGALATMHEIPDQAEIRRENLQRFIAVTGRLEGISLGEGIAAVQDVVQRLHVPPSIRVVYGGTYAEQQQSFHDLVIVLALAVLLVFTVLLLEFRTFAAPVAILASALLSTSGVFFALFITQTTFNLSSFMGLIMVVGIVAKNGILLLDADQRFRAEGLDVRQSMIEAGERRLRPILMTAVATIAGMLPLSLAIGAGSQMLQPLAIAVIGGVAASIVLSLIVTPAVHYFATRSS